MSVTVSGDDELKRRLLSLGKDMTKAMRSGVLLTANQIRTDAIKSIQGQSFGTYVQRSNQGGGGTYTHIASAPGSAPNTDTGKLVSSIAVEMDASEPEGYVGSNLDYASYLEFGTKNKKGVAKMLPRPWLLPAANANEDNLESNITKAVLATIQAKSK